VLEEGEGALGEALEVAGIPEVGAGVEGGSQRFAGPVVGDGWGRRG
jgi:hypothetical protein